MFQSKVVTCYYLNSFTQNFTFLDHACNVIVANIIWSIFYDIDLIIFYPPRFSQNVSRDSQSICGTFISL